MVGLLWKGRQLPPRSGSNNSGTSCWSSPLSLYCAYAIDVFGKDFEVADLDGVLCTHTHLVPSEPNGALEKALNLSIDEILRPKADALSMHESQPPSGVAVMPAAEDYCPVCVQRICRNRRMDCRPRTVPLGLLSQTAGGPGAGRRSNYLIAVTRICIALSSVRAEPPAELNKQRNTAITNTKCFSASNAISGGWCPDHSRQVSQAAAPAATESSVSPKALPMVPRARCRIRLMVDNPTHDSPAKRGRLPRSLLFPNSTS